ncbi:TIGR03085 family metal-binding protein [Nocardioides insulae]|uniref:TIGR03085 family metal-binding protein n=1 Tax=Nocardioides insulae TaxID=394734 RepID=UPI0004214AFF|nr:TIGR03085 family metal-binding protein [Nocardioides insulae]
MTTLARRERAALCDLALVLGPDVPTLCDGWTARDLVRHLVVRERPWLHLHTEGVPGSYDELVAMARTAPHVLGLVSALDRTMNTVEFFVHHEDLRRAQPDWEPRALLPEDEVELWKSLGTLGRVLALKAKGPLVVRAGSHVLTLRRGEDPVTITGPVGELVLFLFGRTAIGEVSFDGPPDAVARLQRVSFGF